LSPATGFILAVDILDFASSQSRRQRREYADNRLTSMVDGIGTTAYSYDQMGRLLSEGGLWPHDTVDYTYQNGLRMQLSLAPVTG
jgi:hypothetical protein